MVDDPTPTPPEEQTTEHIMRQPSPITWSFAKSVGDDGNVYPVMVVHTILGRLNFFYSAEALRKLGNDCLKVADQAEADSGKIVVATPRLHRPE